MRLLDYLIYLIVNNEDLSVNEKAELVEQFYEKYAAK